VAIDAANAGHIFITTSSGSLQLWQQSDLKWIREEGLANIVAADFVGLPEAEAVGAEGEESFVGRIRRQIRDAQVGVVFNHAFVMD
jgi:ER membrane protein complex subunit 1